MTTVGRDRDNDGRCHTVGAGPLLGSQALFGEMVRRSVVGIEFTDTMAATVASWWHGPDSDGAVFSMLSHRIPAGVGVDELHAVIYRARLWLGSGDPRPDDEIARDRQALDMLATWAMNGPGA